MENSLDVRSWLGPGSSALYYMAFTQFGLARQETIAVV